MKKTELESIKNIAKIFLNFEPKKDEQYPFVIDHPFTNSPYVNVNGNLINIIESKDNFDDYITLMNKEINEIQNVIKIYYLISLDVMDSSTIINPQKYSINNTYI